ncbi:MAG: TetR/AcrR family transcriptional regulator, partial [Planctomycetota bacterium]
TDASAVVAALPEEVAGHEKSFDVDEALLVARDLFWERGYDGTGIRDLEHAIGIGRKSLYDTFGSKRELYQRALERYADTLVERICGGLTREGSGALGNLERVLEKLQRHHGAPGSFGCLLGVAMGQARGDDDLAAWIRSVLDRLETAFEAAIEGAQNAGEIRADLAPRDIARQLVALSQGMALLGRIEDRPARTRGVVRGFLQSLSPCPDGRPS